MADQATMLALQFGRSIEFAGFVPELNGLLLRDRLKDNLLPNTAFPDRPRRIGFRPGEAG
jgi:hypothetical protein